MAATTMQTQRMSLAGKTVQSSRPAAVARVCRPVVAVRAQSEEGQTRRAVLGGVLAAAIAVAVPQQALAVSGLDILDGTKLRQSGFDIIYEARDLDLPQAARDGITQFRDSLSDTNKRVGLSADRINGKLGGYVSKKYWTLAREELRGQVGNLRQDVNNIANSFDKTKKKAALASRDAFNKSVDTLDFAIRQKDSDKANSAYAEVKSNLQNLLSSLG